MTMAEQVAAYLPIIETASGRIVGYEVKATSSNGMGISADQLLVDWQQALNDIDSHQPSTKLAMSLSALAILDVSSEFIEKLVEISLQAGSKAIQPVFEIHCADGQLDQLELIANQAKSLGCSVVMGGFDEGFALLDQIARVRPQYIKLNLSAMEGDRTSLQALAAVAKRFGAQVICEGVSTQEDFFFALGCNASHVQGELFSNSEVSLSAADTFVELVHSLLASFRDMAVDAAARNHWLAERVSAELLALRELIRASDLSEGISHYLPSEHLLRFFICDQEGNQISPNYENNKGAWVENNEHLGSNWSWRPYFFELIGGNALEDQLAFSEPYQDINSGQTSQTAAMFIDDKRILLADLANHNPSSIEGFYTCGMRARALNR
ncbi:MAG: EAL domain-containing protein [Pontibacterium sp.]